jgi:hypothetical protein
MFAEEGLDAFIDIELLDQELQQARRPAKCSCPSSCCAECLRPRVAAPPLVRGLRRVGRSLRARFRTRASGRDTAGFAVPGRSHGDLWRSGWREPEFMASAILQPARMAGFAAVFPERLIARNEIGVSDAQNVIGGARSGFERRPIPSRRLSFWRRPPLSVAPPGASGETMRGRAMTASSRPTSMNSDSPCCQASL